MSENTKNFRSLAEYAEKDYETDLKCLNEGLDRKSKIAAIDAQTCLQNGLYVLGAESGLGKTTFATNIALNLALSGEKVLYFSFEQSECDFLKKILSILKEKMSSNENYALNDNILLDVNHSAISNFFLVPANFGLTVEDVEAKIDDFMSSFKGEKPVVFIDYLQVISRNDHKSAKDGIDEVLSSLKQYQARNHLCMFLISSLNRGNYACRVAFESFKETGAIEYTADVVWGLQLTLLNDSKFQTADKSEKRKLCEKAMAENIRKVELVCLKNRFGMATYDCKLEFLPDKCLFRSAGLLDPVLSANEKNQPEPEEDMVMKLY